MQTLKGASMENGPRGRTAQTHHPWLLHGGSHLERRLGNVHLNGHVPKGTLVLSSLCEQRIVWGHKMAFALCSPVFSDQFIVYMSLHFTYHSSFWLICKVLNT